MSIRKLWAVLSAALLLASPALAEERGENMTNLAFFQSLEFDDGLGVVTEVFSRFPLQYAATLGMDRNAQVRPIEFKFEDDGVLYFGTVVFYSSYAELIAHPCIQVCVCDQETMTYVRLGGVFLVPARIAIQNVRADQ